MKTRDAYASKKALVPSRLRLDHSMRIRHLALFFSRAFDFEVDLLTLTLKLVFPPNYFQILRQKNQNPSIWKTLKYGRETILV